MLLILQILLVIAHTISVLYAEFVLHRFLMCKLILVYSNQILPLFSGTYLLSLYYYSLALMFLAVSRVCDVVVIVLRHMPYMCASA